MEEAISVVQTTPLQLFAPSIRWVGGGRQMYESSKNTQSRVNYTGHRTECYKGVAGPTML